MDYCSIDDAWSSENESNAIKTNDENKIKNDSNINKSEQYEGYGSISNGSNNQQTNQSLMTHDSNPRRNRERGHGGQVVDGTMLRNILKNRENFLFLSREMNNGTDSTHMSKYNQISNFSELYDKFGMIWYKHIVFKVGHLNLKSDTKEIIIIVLFINLVLLIIIPHLK